MVVRKDLKVEQERETISFVLEDVFTKQECDELIEMSEKKGYEPALLNVGLYFRPFYFSSFLYSLFLLCPEKGS
jgi:hypothetical protein